MQLEGNLLNPYILGKAVQIHPLGILMAVTAGTILGGIFGAFIAVPLVAVLNNVANDIHKRVVEESPPEKPVPEEPGTLAARSVLAGLQT